MDIDLVIDPEPDQLDAFVRAIEAAGMYVSDVAAHEALAHRSMFNVVDTQSGWKADLIVRKLRSFSEEEFARRHEIEFLGVSLHVASLEDVLLSKLEWAKLGGSARQLEDVASLVRLRGDELDHEYVRHWVQTMGLEAQWSAAIASPER